MDRISFLVNGEPRSVGCETSSDVSLLEYLRVRSELRGTKYLCREGGCGACVVAAARPGQPPHAVNSCLVSVTSCQDWEITTIEDVGNRLKGYHPLQTTLAKLNGTQCGYCSPGWVMAMYSLLKSKGKLTMMEIEKSLGSNICRCTGYRPILEAFKQFASDAPKPSHLLDIEDLSICEKSGKMCRKSKCSESDWCVVEADDVKIPENIEIQLRDGKSWHRVQFVQEIFEVLRRKGSDCYMLVAGNTGKGAYPIDEYPRVLIDISDIQELKGYHFDQNLILGAGNTLTETMDMFDHLAVTADGFWYLTKLKEHLMLVAHIPVRNLGTIAGNLMIKHQHNDFQSDVYLLLETVGAYITIVDPYGNHVAVTPEAFLGVDMRGKIILNILLPPYSLDYKFVSFKIMPRAQNAHAIVNAAFLYKLCPPLNTVCQARIVYGGLSPQFVHAVRTERFLLGKQLFMNDTLQSALRVLTQELVVVENPPEPSARYRRDLALNLFYKGLLSLCPSSVVNPQYASGGIVLDRTRPVSEARQIFTTNPALWPLNQPIEKVEALIQCAGEAPYVEDLPGLPREVFGAFVLTRVPLGNIVEIDAKEALHHPGVIAFYSAKDIPGVNSFTPGDNPFFLSQEELFCSGPVKYNGQVIGVIVAETRSIAEFAAKLVNVKYNNIRKPLIDVKKAKTDTTRTKMGQEVPGTSRGTDVFKVIKGEETIYQQAHFSMETLVSVAKPTEEGLEVHCTTQHMDGVQYMISRALRLPEHKIDVHVRRLGGAYGVKISRGNQVALASALVALKLNRPCRILLPLTTLSKAVGKRLPCSTDYEVAVDNTGKVQYCNENLYMDNGYVLDEPLFIATLDVFNNCYEKARMNYKVFNVTTDTASNTWCRSPGTLEAIASVEFIMERIAYELSLDPLEVRLRNLDPAYTDLREQVDRVKTEAQYADRRASVDKFNSQNRWKKRGLRFSLLRWQPFGGQYFDLTMSVYHDDGTVTITHGGIEMGQGLNTKAVQIAAYILKLSIDKIQIKGNNTIINPNGFISGGSLTSTNIGIGVQRCCEQLLVRLAPIRKDNPDATWEALVKAAFNANVDLQTHGFVTMADTQKVDVYGVTLVEVEVDVLTGEWEVIRVDLLEDAGQSVSPEIDVGQVEGAFIMGLGYWTCEHEVYDANTGAVLTDRTWNYHVPQARDIPQDFRVYFRNNSYSEPRILGAKSIGEPPICMSVAVPFAMREAIVAARRDAGLPANQWFQIVGRETSSDVSLLEYLRVRSELRGTKYLCREGGCGACVVAAARPGQPPHAVNSCLVSVTSCQDWSITTIEGVGNRLQGYHPLQTTLAKYHGTQCGYCSPGWVMAMYSLMQSKQNLTMSEIEQSFGSNVCRCTGYRPILEAFKKFASDAPKSDLLDIEDLNICKKSDKTCRKSKCSDSDWCVVEADDLKVPKNIEIELKDGKLFSKVHSLNDIFEILQRKGDDDYMLVAGNTAKGAYPIHEYPRVLIDISGMEELKGCHFDQNLVLGAGSTLTETIDIFENTASTSESFSYLGKLREHLQLVAHIPVRNIGTIAGNLMIKHQHNEFQSDVFLLFETVGAYITINSNGHQTKVTPESFLKTDMRGKVILNILLPPLGQEYKFISFKIMPRSQSAHAIVNAGFLYHLDSSGTTVKSARIVYGGLSPRFAHTEDTEKFLAGKQLFTNGTLQDAIKVLERELVVEERLPEPSAKYRKSLAINLFYKGLLSLCPLSQMSPRCASGATTLSQTRPVSSGQQDYTTYPTLYPLSKPIEKVEALIQCAGEAPYSEDLPALPREVFGAFVLANVPLADIANIDPSEALHQPGVVAFYSAKDIPGINSFTPGDDLFYTNTEEVFCSGAVRYNGQVIGVVVAETKTTAEHAANLVKVKYTGVNKPIIDIKEAMKYNGRTKKAGEKDGGGEEKGILFNIIKGSQTIYAQHHLCMETLVSVTKPTEEGLEVHCTTQHMDVVQIMISRALNIPENKIDVHVRRLGGAYGLKISRGSQVAVASALVAHKLNRPCRIALPLSTLLKAVGKRLPCYTEYEVGVDLFGKVHYCKENLYMDNGYVVDEPLYLLTLETYMNCYDRLRWLYRVYNVTTDTASNTWCRSPGTLEAIAAAEFIMERIAYETSIDPLVVRLRNLDIASIELRFMVEKLKTKAEYAERRAAADKFNNENRWKKRGLRFSFLRWQGLGAQYLDVTMSVYYGDGTVSITHGGIEMGQGINTKAVQIAAHCLGIPVEKIQIKANNTHVTPNGFISGGSVTSLNVGIGIQRCCEKLLALLAPLKVGLLNPSWEVLVKAAHTAGIDLQAHGFVSFTDLQRSDIFGVTLAEVEVDVLTGEWELLRVDLLEDAGLSISPGVDVGQVEGAFIMGLGYWTTEHLVYDPNSGELLTDRTWDYHVPQARDIPQDFRVYFKEKSFPDFRNHGAKAIGEPPICMSVVVPFALREAIVAARRDAGIPTNQWFQIDGPYTREAIQTHTETKHSDFRFK